MLILQTTAWGSWSEWSPTTNPDTSVSLITQTRTRSCTVSIIGNADNPAPTCSGDTTQSRMIANPSYAGSGSNPADTAAWSEWSEWSPTTAVSTVQTISQSSTRNCIVTTNGIADTVKPTCNGDATQTRTIDNPNYTPSGSSSSPDIRITASNITIRSQSGSDNIINVGEEFDVEVTTENIGTAVQDATFDLAFCYSTSSLSSCTSSSAFDTEAEATNVAINGTQSEISSDTIANSPAGTHYVMVCAYNLPNNDPQDNNCAQKSFSVLAAASTPTIGSPDIRITSNDIVINSRSGDDNIINVGEEIDVDVTTTNIGTVAQDTTFDIAYCYSSSSLSSCNTTNAFDTDAETTDIAVNGTESENSSDVIVGSSAGTHYVMVCAYNLTSNDPPGNNCAQKSFPVLASVLAMQSNTTIISTQPLVTEIQ